MKMFKLERLIWSAPQKKEQKFNDRFGLKKSPHGAGEFTVRLNMLKKLEYILNATDHKVEFKFKTNEKLDIYVGGQIYRHMDFSEVSRDAFISTVIKEFY